MDTNIHHRKAKMYGGTDEPTNLIRVNKKRHTIFHTLFTDPHPLRIAGRLEEISKGHDPKYNLLMRRLFNTDNPHQICWQMNNIWVDPEWLIVHTQTGYYATQRENPKFLYPREKD